MIKEKKQSFLEESNETSEEYKLVLYNDEVNTFQHVINCLVEICRHNPIQAEQCAWLVHNKGKYAVKTGTFEEIKLMCEKMLVEGLSANVE